jgi:hypothetical protein
MGLHAVNRQSCKPYFGQPSVAGAHAPWPSHVPLQTEKEPLPGAPASPSGVHAAPWVASVATHEPPLHACAQSEPGTPEGAQSIPSRLASFRFARTAGVASTHAMGAPAWVKSGWQTPPHAFPFPGSQGIP